MTALAGKARFGILGGEVRINGARGLLSDPAWKHVLGYVPQDDVMMRDLTVEENIVFAAQTRLPADWTADKRRAFAERVIRLLGLAHIRDVVVGDEVKRGISGGQRKRVNIGLELAANPQVLFLDEPTSGLDSAGCTAVCAALQNIAGIGVTVALVLHQPRYEIFSSFDDLLLLGPGGRPVYVGPAADALGYMESVMDGLVRPAFVNPADWILDCVSGDVPAAWKEAHPGWGIDDLFTAWEKKNGLPPPPIPIISSRSSAPPPPSPAPPLPSPPGYGIAAAPPPGVGGGAAENWSGGGGGGGGWLARAKAALGGGGGGGGSRGRGSGPAPPPPVPAAAAIRGASAGAPLPAAAAAPRSAGLLARLGAAMLGESNDGRRLARAGDGDGVELRRGGATPPESPAGAATITSPMFRLGSNGALVPVDAGAGAGAGAARLGDAPKSGRAGSLLAVFGLGAEPPGGGANGGGGGGGYSAFDGPPLKTANPPPPPRPIPPPFWRQVRLYASRSLVQQGRNPFAVVLYNGLTIIAAFAFAALFYNSDSFGAPVPLGALAGCVPDVAKFCQALTASNGDELPTHSFLAAIAISLVGMATFLNVFSTERIVYWREASTLPQPAQTVAYFVGKDLAMLPQMAVGPLLFGLSFFALTTPRAPFGAYYGTFLALYWVASAYGYLVSALVPPALAQLAGVVAVFTTAMFSGGVPTLKAMREKGFPLAWLPWVAFTRYGTEALYVVEAREYAPAVALNGLEMKNLAMDNYGWDLDAFGADIVALVIMGALLRAVALAALVVMNRDKKR
jgi:ABC-type branched-subunit amino acid transport system ATPase component